MHAAVDELYSESVGAWRPRAPRVATSRFTTVADDDAHRSMKNWPTCHLLQWQPSNVAVSASSRRHRFAGRGCRDRFLHLSGLRHRRTYRRFDHLELFVSDPPGANDPLRTPPFWFRTIQVYPKDLRAILRQAQRAVN